jgi:hypothetical protein
MQTTRTLHDRAIFGHIHRLKPAMLRPLQRVLDFLLKLWRDAALERSLQRHHGLFATLLRFWHAEGGYTFPVMSLGVARIELRGEAGVESRLASE